MTTSGRRQKKMAVCRQKRCIILLLLVSILGILPLGGCQSISGGKEKQNLEYTVTAPEDLPEELKKIIDGKKEGEFKLTYLDGSYLYIAVGYGRQPTGGYSIQIPAVYLEDGSIVFESVLLGPEKQEKASLSFPYAVIRTEKREEPVIFR